MVSSQFSLPQSDTLFTTNKKLLVYNTGRLGGNHPGYSLDIPGDCDEELSQPNVEMYLNNASPVIAWNKDDWESGGEQVYTTMYYQRFTDTSGTYRPQGDLQMTSEADFQC